MRLRVSNLLLGILLYGFVPSLCAQIADTGGVLPQPSSASAAGLQEARHSLSSMSDATQGLIMLDVVVTDKSGKPITGLGSTDFTLMENGRPNKILSFHAFDGISTKPYPPVEVILLIDTLNVPLPVASHEREEVKRFLQQDGGHLPEPTAIVELSEWGARWVSQPSRNGNDLAAALVSSKNLTMIRPVRAIPEAAFIGAADSPSLTALKVLGDIATAEGQVPGRKLLIWVGPGWGVESSVHLEGTGVYHDEYIETKQLRQNLFDRICWFSALLRESRVALYTLSVGESTPSARPDLSDVKGVKSIKDVSSIYLYRKVLAVQSGGRVLPPSSDLVTQINSCVQEASVFSTLSFNPLHADHTDEYHDLKVLIDKQGLTARTTTGYYDQPFYSDQPNPAGKLVTVEQLRELLSVVRSRPEGEMVRQLSDVELTERVSDTELASWAGELRGKKAHEALVAVSDASAFLNPPASEIVPAAPPDEETQREIVSLTAGYLHSTMPNLPNYYARQTVDRYEEIPQYDEGSMHVRAEPLHLAQISKATVLYRNGSEVISSGGKDRQRNDRYLITYGTFGPLLNAVRDAIAVPGGLTWSRWEKSPDGGRLAVFRYQVPIQKSRYEAGGCCLPDGNGTTGFAKLAGYHGEVAVDPARGTILRLEIESDLQGFVPLDRSEIMISYGPVEIGGKTYVCPVHSVSVWRARSVPTLWEWDESFKTWGPYATMLNDITFDHYHMYRSESRLLPGYTATP